MAGNGINDIPTQPDPQHLREEARRQTLRQSIMQGFEQRIESAQSNHKMPHEIIANAYDSPLAKGLAGAMNDIYRRVFEQGWFGSDKFDGRFHMDNSVGRDPADTIGDYDTRAAFYGIDQEQGQAQEVEPPELPERTRDMDLER